MLQLPKNMRPLTFFFLLNMFLKFQFSFIFKNILNKNNNKQLIIKIILRNV